MEDQGLSYSDLIKNFEESGELDITQLYKAYKDLTLAALTIAAKYDIKMVVDNELKGVIEGFRQLSAQKVVIKRKD